MVRIISDNIDELSHIQYLISLGTNNINPEGEWLKYMPNEVQCDFELDDPSKAIITDEQSNILGYCDANIDRSPTEDDVTFTSIAAVKLKQLKEKEENIDGTREV